MDGGRGRWEGGWVGREWKLGGKGKERWEGERWNGGGGSWDGGVGGGKQVSMGWCGLYFIVVFLPFLSFILLRNLSFLHLLLFFGERAHAKPP